MVAEVAEDDCCCGVATGDDMVECSRQGRCTGLGWYHLSCVNLRRAPRGKWLCPHCTAFDASVDAKHEHTQLLLWMGLNDRVRHSAVRRNDGPAMVRHWKLDLAEFFTRGHTKYLIHCHRLLSNINGAASPQLAHTLTWNRTVNLVGGPNRNLEIDLYMEFVNKAYKESSKTSRGQLTPATIDRHSRMLAVGNNIDDLFDGTRVTRRKRGKPDRSSEIEEVATYVVQENLAKVIPGRSFRGLEALRVVDWTTPGDMSKFRGRIMEHRLKLYLERHTVDDDEEEEDDADDDDDDDL